MPDGFPGCKRIPDLRNSPKHRNAIERLEQIVVGLVTFLLKLDERRRDLNQLRLDGAMQKMRSPARSKQTSGRLASSLDD